MSTPIKFVLIGCGRIGLRHAGIIPDHGKLAAVCDIAPEKANQLGSQWNATPFYSIDDLLSEFSGKAEVAIICTPNGLHASHTISALKAGFHVLCEKPMAIATTDAEKMVATAKTYNRHLMVVKQNRYNPPVEAVKALLDEGRLGTIYSLQFNGFWNRPADYYTNSWKGTLALDGGTLYTQFSHFIDLLVWFFGPMEPIAATTANLAHQKVIEIEDTGMVIGRFASRPMVSMHYTVNAFGKNMEGSIAIFGEKGTVKIGGQYLNELEYQQLEGSPVLNLPPGNPPNEYGNYTGSMSNHPQVYEALMALLKNEPLTTKPLLDAVETVRTIENIYRIARKK